MTPNQIADVQRSFTLVVPIKEQAAKLFYDRLFSIDPSTKPLFKGDIAEQGKKLMAALALVVTSLTDLPHLIPIVRGLGERHVGYGVEDRHYDSVGEALIWTLEQGLGDGFTADVRAAWLAAYTTLAGVMKEASHASRAAA